MKTPIPRETVGEFLLHEHRLTAEELREAGEAARKRLTPVEEILREEGLVTDALIREAVAEHYRLPSCGQRSLFGAGGPAPFPLPHLMRRIRERVLTQRLLSASREAESRAVRRERARRWEILQRRRAAGARKAGQRGHAGKAATSEKLIESARERLRTIGRRWKTEMEQHKRAREEERARREELHKAREEERARREELRKAREEERRRKREKRAAMRQTKEEERRRLKERKRAEGQEERRKRREKWERQQRERREAAERQRAERQAARESKHAARVAARGNRRAAREAAHRAKSEERRRIREEHVTARKERGEPTVEESLQEDARREAMRQVMIEQEKAKLKREAEATTEEARQALERAAKQEKKSEGEAKALEDERAALEAERKQFEGEKRRFEGEKRRAIPAAGRAAPAAQAAPDARAATPLTDDERKAIREQAIAEARAAFEREKDELLKTVQAVETAAAGGGSPTEG